MADKDRDTVISTLNGLIETCKDGQNGFLDASGAVKDLHLKSLFAKFSQQRAHFAGELQQEVIRLGEDPEKKGSVAASIHRGWINLKAAVTGGSESAIIAECERGEDSAKSEYRKALDSGLLPGDIRAIVERQFVEVKATHDQVRSLEIKTKQ